MKHEHQKGKTRAPKSKKAMPDGFFYLDHLIPQLERYTFELWWWGDLPPRVGAQTRPLTLLARKPWPGTFAFYVFVYVHFKRLSNSLLTSFTLSQVNGYPVKQKRCRVSIHANLATQMHFCIKNHIWWKYQKQRTMSSAKNQFNISTISHLKNDCWERTV